MIRVILVDDEEHALDMLDIWLSEIGSVEVVGICMNPLQALEEVRRQQPDAVFLDIDMPGMNGMEAARKIKGIDPETQIVFTTAHANYTLEAFELHSLDYLLKPFPLERLRNTVQRIEAVVSKRAAAAGNQPFVRCMGEFYVLPSGPGSERIAWRTGKVKELCAFLFQYHGQVIDQAAIMEALWPDAGDSARSYLYTCISLLRKNLRSNVLQASLDKVGNGYRLKLENVLCDAVQLEQLLDHTLIGGVGQSGHYAQIIEKYKGDYLGDCDYTWTYGRRNALADKYVRALRKWFVYFKESHQDAAALQCLELITAVAPDSEQDGRELIRLHTAQGNRSEAIKAYRRLEQAVKVQLNVELETETVRLYEQITSGSG